MKYDRQFRGYFSKIPIFTFKDASRFLKKMRASDPYVKLFVHNQAKRHGLLRVGKGYYTYSGSDAVVGFALSPFYYGLEHSLTLHRLWTQVSIPVVVTSTKAVPGIRESMGRRILVRRISKNMFFGIEYIRYDGMFVPVSDPEKTLIDLFYYNVNLPIQQYSGILKAINIGKLGRYLKRYDRRIAARVLGFAKEYKPMADSGKLESPY